MYRGMFRSCGRSLGCALLLSLPAVVVAESESGGRWFMEAGLIDVESSLEVGSFLVDGQESGWTLSAGYAVNRHLAVQAAYHDLGDNHFATDCPPPNLCLIENTEQVDIYGLSLAAVGRWPINRVFDLHGKLGVLGWDTRFRNSAFDKSGEDLLVGLGIGVSLSPHWRLNLQYEEIGSDLEATGLGVKYQF